MSGDDWQKYFGAIDVGLGGVAPSPPNAAPPPAKPTPPQPPSMMQRAASFSGSMAQFAAGGFRTTSAESQQQRLAICGSCEYNQASNCVLCGCIIPLKVKMPHEHCPINKWPQ